MHVLLTADGHFAIESLEIERVTSDPPGVVMAYKTVEVSDETDHPKTIEYLMSYRYKLREPTRVWLPIKPIPPRYSTTVDMFLAWAYKSLEDGPAPEPAP